MPQIKMTKYPKIAFYTYKDDSYMHKWVDYHIISELRDAGIVVDVINTFLEVDQDVATSNERLVETIKNNRYQLFITDLEPAYIRANVIEEIRNQGVKTLLINFDSMVIPYRHSKTIPFFDLVWIFSEINSEIYRRLGAKKLYIKSYASNPIFSKDIISNANHKRLCFVGSPYGSRANTLNILSKAGIPLDLYYSAQESMGSNNRNSFSIGVVRQLLEHTRTTGGRRIILARILNLMASGRIEQFGENTRAFDAVPIEKISEIYRTHSLTLSFSSARNTDILKKNLPLINLRTFEIAMSGGLQIIRNSSEIQKYFIPGREIITYETNDELIELAKYYLRQENQEACEKMKESARKRSIAEHSWMHRFNDIFRELDLLNKFK